MRLACLHVPRFPVAAWLRADPELDGAPLVVAEGEGARARVVAVSEQAAQAGVFAGMTVAQAVAVTASVVCRPICKDVEDAAHAALCDVAHSFSPRIEEGGKGTVYLDCRGLMPLHGSEKNLGLALVGAAARLGLELYVGIASTRLVAELAAREGGGVTVIPQGEEWDFLAPLLIEVLNPSPPTRERLERWGIRSVGDLAALPASAVAGRLGPEGTRLVRRLRGENERPLNVKPASFRFEEAADLDHDIDTLEALGFVLRGLLDRLTARLALRGFVCGDLHLSLRLADRSRDERTVTVRVPANDVKALLALVRLQLEARPPRAPVGAVRLSAAPERVRATQLDLFRPSGPSPQRLAVTLARLTALCGAERVGLPAVVDSHRPDDLGRTREIRWLRGESSDVALSPGKPEKGSKLVSRFPALALRAIRPPRPLEVFVDRGRPDFVRPLRVSPPKGSRHGQPTISEYPCTGRVVAAAGPWRLEGNWWDNAVFSRDYYDVQLSDGVVYRLFFEAARQGWFVDGVYD